MIKSADFVKSSQNIEQCPTDRFNEVAFIGRSNVGKSSLINALTNKKNLAKVSSVPGKTQLINHFLIDNSWYLVDLPGYGWAKVGQQLKEKWEKDINEYLIKREKLSCVFVLLDVRHEPQKNDINFLDWLVENEIPISIIFTKSDKLSPNKVDSSVARYKKVLKSKWEELPKYFVTSSFNKNGIDEIHDFILSFINE